LRDLINKIKPKNQKGSLLHRRVSRKNEEKRHRKEDASAVPSGLPVSESWDVSHFKVPPAEGKARFHDFDLPNPLLHAICDLGFEY
jgi:ATP-dependent RNA helicase RhlB